MNSKVKAALNLTILLLVAGITSLMTAHADHGQLTKWDLLSAAVAALVTARGWLDQSLSDAAGPSTSPIDAK